MLDVRSRRGAAGTVTHLADLIDSVAIILPARTSTALARWRRLGATLQAYSLPVVGPARANAIAGLLEAADAEAMDVDHIIGSKLLEERHRHERAVAFREVLAEAIDAACAAVLASANADEHQLVVAAQSRYSVMVAELPPSSCQQNSPNEIPSTPSMNCARIGQSLLGRGMR